MTVQLRPWPLLLAALALFIMALPGVSAPVITPGGYVQARFNGYFGDNEPNPTFALTRAYVYVNAMLDQHVGAFILARASGSNFNAPVTAGNFNTPSTSGAWVEFAYAKYVDAPYEARLGLGPVPFGYEAPLSSSALVTLERSQPISAIFDIGGANYHLDRGLYAYYLPKQGGNLSLALVNGGGLANLSDPNAGKTAIGRAGFVNSKIDVGVSAYAGSTGGTPNLPSNTSAVSKKYVAGLDLRTSVDIVKVISEAVYNTNQSIRSAGGYITIYTRPKGWDYQPYFRYDVYDPNTKTSNDAFQRGTAGVSYFLNATSRLTAELQYIANMGAAAGKDKHYQTLTGQYQVLF